MNNVIKVSEPKVMKSAAGYYIGSTYPEIINDTKYDLPFDRYSEYFETKKQADEELVRMSLIAPENNNFEEIDYPMIMDSSLGYYVGSTYLATIDGKKHHIPHDRYSEYFETKDQAEKALLGYINEVRT
jgi:hypothetical protein